MASKRFDEFIKNASPELKSKITEAGKESLKVDGTRVNPPSEYSDQSPDRNAKLTRGHAAPPEPSYDTTNQPQAERRIDQAMNQKVQAQAVEQGQEAAKSGASVEPSKAPPAKEPER